MFHLRVRSLRSEFRYVKRKPGSVMLSGFCRFDTHPSSPLSRRERGTLKDFLTVAGGEDPEAPVLTP